MIVQHPDLPSLHSSPPNSYILHWTGVKTHYLVKESLEALAREWPAVGPGNWFHRLLGKFIGTKPAFPFPSAWDPLVIAIYPKGVFGVKGVTGLTTTDDGPRGKGCIRVTTPRAIPHELVHWALFRLTGWPSPEHDSREGSWWTPEHTKLVERVTKEVLG